MRKKHFVEAEIEPDVEKIDLAGKGGERGSAEEKKINKTSRVIISKRFRDNGIFKLS